MPAFLYPIGYQTCADQGGRHACSRMCTGSDEVQVMVMGMATVRPQISQLGEGMRESMGRCMASNGAQPFRTC